MPVKVKRGLGLLVVALIAWPISYGLLQADPDGALGEWVLPLLGIAASCVLVAAAFGGLVLLAWGLLRD